jgi:hypothetical protein
MQSVSLMQRAGCWLEKKSGRTPRERGRQGSGLWGFAGVLPQAEESRILRYKVLIRHNFYKTPKSLDYLEDICCFDTGGHAPCSLVAVALKSKFLP